MRKQYAEKDKMKILGIETSCDETAMAVVEIDGGEVIVKSNIVSSQIATHAQYGGVVPKLAAREHLENIRKVYETACQDNSYDLIAVTNGPGLAPALLIGVTFARTMAWKYDKPIVGVDHMAGHIYSNWLTANNHAFPALNLLASGGHTELVIMTAHNKFEIIGETLDDAVGEAFDKVARMLNLEYPGGPAISRIAKDGNPLAYPLPEPMKRSAGLNFSYSGLKTAVLYLIRNITGEDRELTESERADVAASFQRVAVESLISKTRVAIAKHNPQSLMLSGGVSANIFLREEIKKLGAELDLPVYIPDLAYTGDNGAMIAVAGYFAYKSGVQDQWGSLAIDANLRLGHNLKA